MEESIDIQDEDKDKGENPRIGMILRGQAWVELHGIFTVDELHLLIQEIGERCKGLVREDGA